MQANRFRLLARGLVLLTIAFASCSDGDEAVGERGGSAGDSSCTACAGEDSGSSGEGGSGTANGGTRSIEPAAGSNVGGAGGTSSAGSGNTPGGEGGGPEGPVLEELSICDRLTQVPDKNLKTTKAFELSVYSDCRVKWLADLYLDAKKRDDFLNDLLTWNQKFWGCQEVPVDNFALVWGTPSLSQGDADVVVGYYLSAAREHLDLTPKEEQEMREALDRLAMLVVTSTALDPSRPACPDPNGGAGGQDGSGGAAGTAGEAGIASGAAGSAASGGGAP